LKLIIAGKFAVRREDTGRTPGWCIPRSTVA